MDRTDHPPFTRITTVLLVAAPLLMAIGAVFLVRWDDQDWAGVLTDMAAHRTRSDLGWLLALAASGLLVLPGLALAALVRDSRPRTAAFATVTTALGWTGSAGICSAGVFMSAMAVSPARDAQIQVLTDANSGASNVIYLLCVAGAVGMIALAVALAKSGAAPVGAAVLIGLGGAGTLLVMPGPVKVLLVLTALLLAAGQAWVLAATRSARPVPVPDALTR